MKRTKYYISHTILIPVIFTGISILSILGASWITTHSLQTLADPTRPLWIWALTMGIITFVCGLLIAWIILKPLKSFVKGTQHLDVLPKAVDPAISESKDEIEYFTEVIEQVTRVLTQVEAQRLFPSIIGQSEAIRTTLSQILKVAPTDSTVLITGESGTGKELVATSIYEHSSRKGRPFIKLNCVAIPESLLESELFGHEKGAFTGAIAQKKGKFELAHCGTIFLDEIADMPISTQAKLLRVLQEREIERVGGMHTLKIDVRIIAATNKNLPKMVKEQRFREDLFYRLNVVSLHLPPLRERKDDIPELTRFFLARAPAPMEISDAALDRMMAYNWPGNVRELQNVLERACVMAEEDRIEPAHFPSPIRCAVVDPFLVNSAGPLEEQSIDDRLRELERTMIVEALKRSGGVQAKAARLLGISQRSLWHRIKKHGIDPGLYKK